MASESIQRLADAAESARSSLKRWKDKARISEARAVSLAESVGGAVAAAAIDKKLGRETGGRWELLGVPATPAVGAVGALLSLSGFIPGAEHVGAVAIGFLCGPAYTYAYNKFE